MLSEVHAEFRIAEDDHVRTWLAVELAFNRQHNRNGSGALHYLGPQHFVLAEGRTWPSPAEEDPDYPDGRPRNCYEDAMSMALVYRDLTYVEGYAWCGHLVVPHAWTVKPSGEVLDVTWRESIIPGRRVPRETWIYLGVPFDYRFAWKQTEQNGEYGIIDAWSHGFPLLREPLPRRALAERWR